MDERKDEIGLAEAAQLLRLPYQSAHRLVLMGELAAVKRSGRWFVRRADAARLCERSDSWARVRSAQGGCDE